MTFGYKIKTRGLYQPEAAKPFKVSRSGIESFLECPKCFYLNNVLGVKRPDGFPFNINKAVDTLLKREFDLHRVAGTPHPFMTEFKIDAIPFQHELIDDWRENFVGVQHLHEPTNLKITGAVDDIWVNENDELIVVDYKATSKNSEVNIDADWQMSYKRQMEIYQWLLRQNDFKVSKTGYFVYCNGKSDLEQFNKRVEFDVALIPYTGDSEWVDDVLFQIKDCLDSEIPEPNPACQYCAYVEAYNTQANQGS